jgi:hypothetical protein
MLKKLLKKISFKICLEVGLLLLTVGMGIYFQWEIANLVFFALFIFLILHPLSSRLPALGAIILLVATAVLLVAKKEDLAETSAIWAYYFLIFTATMSFFELRGERDDAIIDKN